MGLRLTQAVIGQAVGCELTQADIVRGLASSTGLTYKQLVASSHNWAAPLHRLSQQEEAAKSRFCLITIKQSNNHPWEEEGDEEEEDEEGDEVKEGNEEYEEYEDEEKTCQQ